VPSRTHRIAHRRINLLALHEQRRGHHPELVRNEPAPRRRGCHEAQIHYHAHIQHEDVLVVRLTQHLPKFGEARLATLRFSVRRVGY
jgi:hypothetical protein